MLTPKTVVGPSHWAPYLINLDSSLMTDEEISQATAWVKSLGYGSPVSCEHYGIGYFEGKQCDLKEYTFLVDDEPSLEEQALDCLQCIATNAELIDDPRMKGATDCFAVPCEDIDRAISIINQMKIRMTGRAEW